MSRVFTITTCSEKKSDLWGEKTMAEEDKTELGRSHNLSIDYDNPDVEDIMRQIKEEIASCSVAAGPAAEEEPVPEPASPMPPPPEMEPLEFSRARRLLLKLMRPFAPLIKLLILPVHQDFLETVNRLDYTNRRLDFLFSRMELGMNNLSQELSLTGAAINQKADEAHRRLDKAFYNLGRTMEYTKLLHSLTHNLVVELSKLKIEEEDIKVKARILEKDFEFLRGKEKALEKQVMK
jgi:hypothetical protein